MSAADFYNKVYTTARTLGATDTQARLAAAQASLETGYGTSVTGNNYFGVKTKAEDAAPGNVKSTTEYVNGKAVTVDAAFRGYQSLDESVQNYMDFMANRFPDAWNAPTVAEAASHLDNGVEGRYATDPKYETKINSIAKKFSDAVQPSLFTDQQVVNAAGDMVGAAKGFGGMLFDAASGLVPSFSSPVAKAAPFSDIPDIQPIDGLNWNGKMMAGSPVGITAHGTGGMGTPAGIIDAMNKRAIDANIPNLGAQYVMDRDGNIFQAAPNDARISHMKPSDDFAARNAPPGLSNGNMIGIEMITGKDQMLSDAQKQSFQGFVEKMKADNPSISSDNIYTHSEVNPGHKMTEEGQAAVGMYRNREMMRNPNPTPPSEGLLAQSLPSDINAPNLNQALAATTDFTPSLAPQTIASADNAMSLRDGPASLSTSGPTSGNDTFGLINQSPMTAYQGQQSFTNPFDALLQKQPNISAVAPPMAPVQASASMSSMAPQPGAMASVGPLLSASASLPVSQQGAMASVGPLLSASAALPVSQPGAMANVGPLVKASASLPVSQPDIVASARLLPDYDIKAAVAPMSVPGASTTANVQPPSKSFADPAVTSMLNAELDKMAASQKANPGQLAQFERAPWNPAPSYDVSAAVAPMSVPGASATATVENPGFWGDLANIDQRQTAAASLSPASDAAAQGAMANFSPAFTAPVSASMPAMSAMPGASGTVGSVPSSMNTSNMAAGINAQRDFVAPMSVPGAMLTPNFSSAYNSTVHGMVNPTATEGFSVPSVAPTDVPSIAGPAQTSIPSQQFAAIPAATQTPQTVQKQAPVAAVKPTKEEGFLSSLGINPGSMAGGLVGGMAAGPVGGLIGALLGGMIAKNGGLESIMKGEPISINNIGSGLSNVQSVYGGAPVGTQASTNNGGRVTSLPGDRVAYTNSYGVTTVSNADGTGQGAYYGDTKF